ncbi:MAG: DNA starvation/stationary phase protection protein [Microbacterium pygmaeum]|uniref:Starvation-inducible DNA-binding protein n=1 Tax=Microbacterium pygmaeum TaxID=370764 RepID=A0A1G7WCS1_9MICO|nr:DNA starvation/stationary phase protection protein [Microbacterium pygmaeum]SDG69758.1 starvation-inducible DNA-binding protein [Microbacterium pygmaeum]
MATTQKSAPPKKAAAKTSTSARTAKGGVGVKPTRRQNAEKGFVASPKLDAHMQAVLVDLLELAMQGKQAHWNVVGRNFRDTHRILDEIIEAAREFSDTVAERMRALHAVPDGRSDTVAETTTLAEYPQGEIDTAETVDLITARLESVVGTMRDVHDEVDEEDPTSADILHAVIEKLEQFAWMVSAENRTPAARG